ncbi:MAG: type II secretion system protein [Vampirovibrionales bacterium]
MHPCTHAPIITQIPYKGFTLSELLISLAVLGLISALTLPTIFNTVSEQRSKAGLKEAITAFQSIAKEGVDDGSIYSKATFIDALKLKLNFVEHRTTACTEIFHLNHSGYSASMHDCFILPNGIMVNVSNATSLYPDNGFGVFFGDPQASSSSGWRRVNLVLNATGIRQDLGVWGIFNPGQLRQPNSWGGGEANGSFARLYR